MVPLSLPGWAGRGVSLSLLAAAVLGSLGAGCASSPDPATGANASAAGDWQVLFDGSDLSHWKGYGRDDVPAGWVIDGDALHHEPGTEGGDLVTREAYGDFELAMEWKIGPCGNSGIFYRGAEGHDAVWESAPEMQVLDDACGDQPGSPEEQNVHVYLPFRCV